MNIIIDKLQHPEIITLLEEHLRDMAEHSPPESVHALDLAALRAPEITFWTAWEESQLLGCGALKELTLQITQPCLHPIAFHLNRILPSFSFLQRVGHQRQLRFQCLSFRD